ncbi:MAG: Crp/Fnr family transcriptional regulator [Desulfotomaculum sp.]|nr:Crp/Fnr family transcriptional regulator [Desulfotomaculum sp.]
MGKDKEDLLLNEREKKLIRNSGVLIHYPKGHTLFSAGDVADRIYLIESGYVKIYRIATDGKRVTVGSIRKSGELMGLAETLYHGERTCFAGAINDVKATVVTKKTFEELLQEQPLLAIKVARLLGVRMREAEALVHELVCWQVPGRLALLLLKVSELAGVTTEKGIKIDLRLTHEEMANMIGTSRQTVTSTLNNFKQEGSINMEGREIYIINKDKLLKWIK